MLSAKDLIESRNKTLPELPSFGVKNFVPDNSNEQMCQIQNSVSEIEKVVSYKKVKMIGSLSQAVWRPKLNLAEIVHQTGSHWTIMGHTIDQKLYIYPEEALYLLEIGALEISFNGVSLSIQRAYFVLLSQQTDLNIDKYRVYSYLNNHGYKVLRHSFKNTVTKYEKQLEVHKLGIKLKNFDSYFKSEKRHQNTTKENFKNNKKLKLEKEIKFPILCKDSSDKKEILRKMQIFQPYNGNMEGNINFSYDIYTESLDKHSFKKSCLQIPNYRVIVYRSEDPMPDLREIYKLSTKYEDEIPIVHAIVFPDYIAFYEINPKNLPDA